MREPHVGVSAVGFRLEGGFNGPHEPANQWAAWERAGKVPVPAEGSGGIWSDPDRVLDGASLVGAEEIELCVEWARIEPAPGRIDHGALDRYASIFDSASARGIAPIAVLHDVAHPGWLGEELWLTPGSPDRFADHVALVASRLAPTCTRWVTVRQPNMVAIAGWLDGRHPPRRVGALSDAWAVVDNLLTAHVLACEAVHDVQPSADVLFGLRAASSYDWGALMVDLLCAPALGVEREELDVWVDGRRAAHDASVPPGDLAELAWRRLAGATSPYGGSRAGRRTLRRPSPRRVDEVLYRPRSPGGAPGARSPASQHNGSEPGRPQYPMDSLLVLWSPPAAEPSAGRAGRAAGPWARPPDAEALAEWCRRQSRATPGLPVWVEDGFATCGGDRRPDGWDRAGYLRSVRCALADAPIAGYLYYSLDGGGEPTWPDADFGLRGRADSDLAAYRELFDGWRSASSDLA